jgi:hypothetical protein
MLIRLTSIREECGGCPTYYSGETATGDQFEAYLRHGFMKVELNSQILFTCNPSGLDGICSFDDFKSYARKNGIFIDNSEATYSSRVQEDCKAMENLFKDKIWVEFTRDFVSKAAGITYEKGKRYTASLKLADLLVEKGMAIIVDQNIESKRKAAANN